MLLVVFLSSLFWPTCCQSSARDHFGLQRVTDYLKILRFQFSDCYWKFHVILTYFHVNLMCFSLGLDFILMKIWSLAHLDRHLLDDLELYIFLCYCYRELDSIPYFDFHKICESCYDAFVSYCRGGFSFDDCQTFLVLWAQRLNRSLSYRFLFLVEDDLCQSLISEARLGQSQQLITQVIALYWCFTQQSTLLF